jgi:hypothetical protein
VEKHFCVLESEFFSSLLRRFTLTLDHGKQVILEP